MLNNFAVSIYLYTLLVEFTLNKPFDFEHDWLYKYSLIIAIPIWLAFSATCKDRTWKVLLLQTVLVLMLLSGIVVLLCAKNLIYGTQLFMETTITLCIGILLMYIFNRLGERLKLARKNT